MDTRNRIAMEVSAHRHQQKSFSSVVALNLYRWALRELTNKGYSSRVADKVISRSLYQLQGQWVQFIQWVNDQPSYKSPVKIKVNGKSFVQHQLTRTVLRILIGKGYSERAAFLLTKRLIKHAGGSDRCDLNAVLAAARQWPENEQVA